MGYSVEEMKLKLEEFSTRLGISVTELIDRYVRIGLYMDDYFDDYPSKVLEENRRKEVDKLKQKALKNENSKIEKRSRKFGRASVKSGFEDKIRRFSMYANYEIQDEKLKGMIEKKAEKLNTTVDSLVWGYVGRGLMGDIIAGDRLVELHTNGFLEEINEIMGLKD